MICVDPLVGRRSPSWNWGESCHLFTDDDNYEELYEFGRKLNLDPIWFQFDKRLPHYDITRKKREAAVKAGAREVNMRYVRGVIHRRRSQA